jgi:hypothetical protein
VNTFGQPYVAGVTAAIGPFPLYDPREARESRQRFRRDVIPALERANSFYCPTGRWPSRGWILLARSDYNQLNQYSDSLVLEIGDSTDPNNVSKLTNLSIVQARCVTRGLTSDPNALYLVELTDDRGILYNKWFQVVTTSMYNIRAPAYPQTFHPGSMNGGTTWTWNTMFQDLWNQMNVLDGGNILGAYPGLPAGVTISGTPEGFWFSGVPAWYALNDILEYVGLTIACDLTQANPFTIVQPGAVDNTFTALQTKYLTNLENDLEWIDTGAGRVPSSVTVLFRRRNSVYGTEETVTFGDDGIAKQWDMATTYSVSVNAPVKFTGAVGTHYLWSDFTVRYDQNSLPLTADVTTANQIAQERVTQYFARIYRQTAGYMSQTYASALPFTTGSQVDGVCWRMDHRAEWEGWHTELVRGPSPPWPDLWDD